MRVGRIQPNSQYHAICLTSLLRLASPFNCLIIKSQESTSTSAFRYNHCQTVNTQTVFFACLCINSFSTKTTFTIYSFEIFFFFSGFLYITVYNYEINDYNVLKKRLQLCMTYRHK